MYVPDDCFSGWGRLREDEGRKSEVEEGILEALQLMPTHHLQQFYTYLIRQNLCYTYFGTVAHTYYFCTLVEPEKMTFAKLVFEPLNVGKSCSR